MKKKTRTNSEFIPTSLPTNPCTGGQIAERLLLKVQAACGYAVPYEILAAHSGKSRSSLHRWYVDVSHHHLQTLFAQLELLTRAERQRFCDEVCRDLPGLDHPRLAHDPHGVLLLRALVRKPTGLTWISGASPLASFIVAALGHSFTRLDPQHRPVTGLSAYSSEYLVPLFGVTYLPPLLTAAEQKAAQQQIWPAILKSESPLILLDGVGTSDVSAALLRLAQNRHVVLTGAPQLELVHGARRKKLPTHAIKVTAGATRHDPIALRKAELGKGSNPPR